MATIKVSSNSGLASALRSARGGDTIDLASGHYALSLKNSTKDLTITSSKAAVIDSMRLDTVSNVTISGVDFNGRDGEAKAFVVRASSNVTIRNGDMEGVASGYGEGKGLWVGQTKGFTLDNMTLHGFSTGAHFVGMTDLVVRNNTFTNIKWDGIIAGQLNGARFVGNDIDLHSTPGLLHSDGMQFWNTGVNKPSSDILIQDNVIQTHNKPSHGIYMANAVANGSGHSNAFFHNVTIHDNTVLNGDGFGIAWGQTAGLHITDNIILRDLAVTSAGTRGNVPHILVHNDSTGVTVTGNYTHMQPWPANAQWQQTKGEPGWNVTGNHIVPTGTRLADIDHSGGHTYRFDAIGAADVVSGLDFGGGDVIELYNYPGGTFHAQRGGNDLKVTIHGAVLDSTADLRELDAASNAVTIHRGSGDTLVIDIDQPTGAHSLHLLEFAHAYF
jgi:hypothetical protein